MKKTRFVEEVSVDINLLKQKRKEVLGYSIFCILFALVPHNLIEYAGGFNIFTFIHLLAGTIFALVFIAFIQGIRSLFQTTKMIYRNPLGYFIAYFLLIFFGGFVMGFFAIFGLASLWFEIRQFLK